MGEKIEELSLEQLQEIDAEGKSQQAEAKLAELRAFRENVSSSLVPIQSALKDLQTQFSQIQYSSEDGSGVLTAAIDSYRECLEMDSAKLEKLDRLLAEDFKKWQVAESQSKLLVQRIKSQIIEVLRQ